MSRFIDCLLKLKFSNNDKFKQDSCEILFNFYVSLIQTWYRLSEFD